MPSDDLLFCPSQGKIGESQMVPDQDCMLGVTAVLGLPEWGFKRNYSYSNTPITQGRFLLNITYLSFISYAPTPSIVTN